MTDCSFGIDNLEALAQHLEAILQSASALDSAQSDFHLDLILCFTARGDSTTKLEDKINPSVLDTLTGMETSSAKVRIENRRPDLKAILDEVVKYTVSGGVGVGACGPGLVEGLEKLVNGISKGESKRAGGVEIHAERFSL